MIEAPIRIGGFANSNIHSFDQITAGSNGGLGRALVLAALSRGDLVVAAARDPTKNNDLESSDNLRLLRFDVTDQGETIEAKIKEACEVWGRIDVLANFAAMGYIGLSEEIG